MNKILRALTLFLFLIALPSLTAQVPQTPVKIHDRQNTIDVSVAFTELHTNAPVGFCNCFWMPGGTAEASVPIWRNFSAVGELGGQHTIGNIPGFNVALGLVSGMGGLRLRFPNHTLYQPYAQALVGGIHGFDSYFPTPDPEVHPPTSYASSFVMAIGGGLDLAVSRHIWIRALQADYHYSQLPNLQGDRQNQFRIGAGFVWRK